MFQEEDFDLDLDGDLFPDDMPDLQVDDLTGSTNSILPSVTLANNCARERYF